MSLLSLIAKAQAPVPMIYSGREMAMPKVEPYSEVGVTGLLRTRGVGFVFEEWLPALSVNRQRQVYRQMRDNDAVLGALFFAIEMILRRADWNVEAEGTSSKAADQAEFVDSCINDLSHTWEDFIAECVSMLVFGFAYFEIVYKRRKGQTGKTSSRFNDGKVGWRKFAPRAQESLLYWDWDPEGGLQGAVQLAAPEYRTVPLPINKCLLFRTTSVKNSPEGRSILRNCYRPWVLKTRDEEIEGIGLERDLCGMPVLYASAKAIREMGGMNVAKKFVRDVRMDDQMGAVLPQAFDEKGNRAVLFELLKSQGRKQTNAGEIIKRHNQDMLNTALAGFIQLGQTEHGARALHISATQIFADAIAAFMDSVAAVVNRIAIPRLLAMNPGMDLSLAPKVKPGEIVGRDLTELGDYVSKLSAAGIPFIDRQTATILRQKADLPEEPEDDTPRDVPFGTDDQGDASGEKPQGAVARGKPGGKPPAIPAMNRQPEASGARA